MIDRFCKKTMLTLNPKIMKPMKNWNSMLVMYTIVALLAIGCAKEETEVVVANEETIAVKEAEEIEGTQDSNNPNDDDYGMISLYNVANGVITTKVEFNTSGELKIAQEDRARHQEIWNRVATMIPAEYLSKMDEFMLYWGEYTGSSGFVVETNPDLSKFIMGIAIDFVDLDSPEGERNLNGLIAHEFGHILSLNDTQVDWTIGEEECQNFNTGSGCSRPGSFMNTFFNANWADIWPERQIIQDMDGNDDEFFATYESRFVSRYAGTNPTEDIAEVFSYFVMQDKLPTTGTSKVEAMYANEELNALRIQMRSNIGLTTAKNTLVSAKANQSGNAKTKTILLVCGFAKSRRSHLRTN